MNSGRKMSVSSIKSNRSKSQKKSNSKKKSVSRQNNEMKKLDPARWAIQKKYKLTENAPREGKLEAINRLERLIKADKVKSQNRKKL